MASKKQAPTSTEPQSTPKPRASMLKQGGKVSSKFLAYKAWVKANKTKNPEVLLKATNSAVKKVTCQAWISFWLRGTNLPREFRAEAKAKAANPKPKAKVKAQPSPEPQVEQAEQP
jgi:hypothetical protein